MVKAADLRSQARYLAPMKMHITNRRYSSWSLRGWLAAKQSGLPIEEVFVDIYSDDWAEVRKSGVYGVAAGKVPVLEDGDSVVWNAIAIIEWLDAKSGRSRFWPAGGPARAYALSAAVEMQAGFMALRQACPMNCMRHYPGWTLAAEAEADVARVQALWESGLAQFGGPWLAGKEWGAVDILFAPVVSRLTTYDVKLSPAADDYRKRAMAHPLVAEWVAEAARETTIKANYEF